MVMDWTPVQRKWITDYQRVRGITLLVGGCYPLSTHDHHMTGERPHFGPVDPLWDFLPVFHRYSVRVGYVLACGQPVIESALYYPVRRHLGNGRSDKHGIARTRSIRAGPAEEACDSDVIDDDAISSPTTAIRDGRMRVGPMSYRTIVVGPTEWMTDTARRRLEELEATGGRVIRVNKLAQIDEAVARITPTLVINPFPPTSAYK